jgi:hypothetical protein
MAEIGCMESIAYFERIRKSYFVISTIDNQFNGRRSIVRFCIKNAESGSRFLLWRDRLDSFLHRIPLNSEQFNGYFMAGNSIVLPDEASASEPSMSTS